MGEDLRRLLLTLNTGCAAAAAVEHISFLAPEKPEVKWEEKNVGELESLA
jgi:hypothetical protein